MISEKQVLKKIGDNTLIEDKPAREDGRALEWCKDFETLEIQLSDVKINTNFTVNAVDADGTFALGKILKTIPADETIFQYIKPSADISRRVIGKCLDFNDKLYRLVKESEDLDLYKCVRFSAGIRVTIMEIREEPQSGESYPNGVYYGSLFWLNESHRELNAFEPEIECRIPSSQMDKLINAITQTPSSEVQIRVEVLSFRWEVDKGLSEPWMSKDLLLEENSPALLTSINVASSLTAAPSNAENLANRKTKDPLKRITMLLWAISALLLLQLYK